MATDDNKIRTAKRTLPALPIFQREACIGRVSEPPAIRLALLTIASGPKDQSDLFHLPSIGLEPKVRRSLRKESKDE